MFCIIRNPYFYSRNIFLRNNNFSHFFSGKNQTLLHKNGINISIIPLRLNKNVGGSSQERLHDKIRIDLKNEKTKGANALLLLSCACIFGTMVMGAYTRKQKAGLSMTTWNFFSEKFPSTEEEWAAEFALYQQIPEYQLSENDITLEEFKKIFKLEYYHRMAGRCTGVAVLAASLLLLRGKVKGDKVRAVLYSSLIVAQGFMGWYMVKSGLKEETMNSMAYPTVSAYRLVAHNALAITLLTLMLYRGISGLNLPQNAFVIKNIGLFKVASRFNHFVLLSYFLTVLSGSYVAGTHSGVVHNTFPLMSGSYVPEDMFQLEPKYRNFFENPATIQFVHRNLAYATFGVSCLNFALTYSCFSKLPFRVSLACASSSFLVLLQIMLGAHCLMTCTQSMSEVHQANSIITMSSLIWLATEFARIKKVIH